MELSASLVIHHSSPEKHNLQKDLITSTEERYKFLAIAEENNPDQGGSMDTHRKPRKCVGYRYRWVNDIYAYSPSPLSFSHINTALYDSRKLK